MESLGNSRTSHSDTRVVKPEYLTRLFNRLLCLMAVECGLTKHESSGAAPRKIPKSPQLYHYQWLHRPAAQRNETGENASWAGPGGIWLLAKIACLAAASAVMPSHKPCVVDVQSVRPILQLWKLRLTRAQSTPAASTIEECPEGEKLFQEVTEHWDRGSITGNCHLGCWSDHPGNI